MKALRAYLVSRVGKEIETIQHFGPSDLLVNGIRIEISSIPAELVPEIDQLLEPVPETTTLKDPEPITIGSKSRGRKK